MAMRVRHLTLVRAGVLSGWLTASFASGFLLSGADLSGAAELTASVIIGPLCGLAGALHAFLGFKKAPPLDLTPTDDTASLVQRARRGYVVRYLRTHPGSTAEQIAAGTHTLLDKIHEGLVYMELDGYVTVALAADGAICYTATDKEL